MKKHKNHLFTLLLSIIFLQLSSCAKKNPAKSCSAPYFVSANAHALIDTYRDLVKQVNGDTCGYDNRPNNPPKDSIAFGNYYCVPSSMPLKGYKNTAGKGYITFTSTYWYKHNIAASTIPFRTLWYTQFDKDERKIFGTCAGCYATPIVLPNQALADHVFQAILVKTDDFKASTISSPGFSGSIDLGTPNPLASIAVKPVDIQKINGVFVECEGEFMSSKFKSAYNNPNSSVGVVCEVVLKNGQKVNCYIFNNEENSSITWKQLK